MEQLEMAIKISEKANISIEEAKYFLERNNWDMLDTMVELERAGKIGSERTNGATVTSDRSTAHHYEQVTPTASRGENRNEKNAGKEMLKNLWSGLKALFRKSLSNDLVITKNEETKAEFPVLILVVMVLAAFWLTVILLIVGLCFGLRYSFKGEQLGKDSINSVMGKAADFAQEIVSEFKNEQSSDGENHSGENHFGGQQ